MLLVLLRLAQGGAIGGELVGSMCYLVEAAPPERRALFGSLTIVGIALGVLLASGVVAIARALLPSETMHAWGWRLPFLATWLIQSTGDLAAPAWYLCAAAVVTNAATLVAARGGVNRWRSRRSSRCAHRQTARDDLLDSSPCRRATRADRSRASSLLTPRA